MKKVICFFSMLFFIGGAIGGSATAASKAHYFLVVPQSEGPPDWQPSPDGSFPILNRESIKHLTDKFGFIKNIALYQPELLEVGSSRQNKTQVINYCFGRDNFLMAEVAIAQSKETGQRLLMSEQLISSLGLDRSDLPVTVTKFVEVHEPVTQSRDRSTSNGPSYIMEQLVVHGVVPSSLKLGKSNQFIFTNDCTLPSDENQAKSRRFDPSYAMPHTLLIKSSTSDIEQLNGVVQQLNEFFEGSRPGLDFHVEQVFK